MERPASTRSNTGFSLVEITVAIGIFSVCIVTIIWLMGTTLTTSHESQTDTAIASILRSLEVRVHTLPGNTDLSEPLIYWFDVGGNLIPSTDSGALYRATLTPVPRSRVQAFADLPRETGQLRIWTVELIYPAPAFGERRSMLVSRFFLKPVTP